MDAIYRATIYAPRSEDASETTILNPIGGASHNDDFKVATIEGVSGFQPYLDPPRGRRGSIDPIKRTTSTGQLTLSLIDKRVTEGGSNLSRWVTAFHGNDEGRTRFIGSKVYVEISVDGGSGWDSYFTGRIQKTGLRGRIGFDITVRDMEDDLDFDIFVGRPEASITYANLTPLIPGGIIEDYGPFPTVSKLQGEVRAWGGMKWIDIDTSSRRERIATIITSGFPNLIWYGSRIGLRTDSRVRIYLKITSGARINEEGEFNFAGGWGTSGGGAISAIRKDGNGHFHIETIGLAALPATDPDYLALPPTSETVEFFIYASLEPTEDRPLYIDEVHPCQLWKDILDGKFSLLDDQGDPLRTVAYDSAAFATLIADTTIPNMRLPVFERDKAREWIEKYILRVYNLATYTNEDGEVVPVDMRLPNTLGGIPTLTDSDTYVKDPGGWDQDRASVINHVRFRWYWDVLLDAESITESAPGIPEVAPSRIIEVESLMILANFGRPELGEKGLTIDARGFRAALDETNQEERAEWIRRTLLGYAEELKGPFGSGAAFASLRFQRVANVTDCYPGDLRVIDIDVLPDPASNLRGGARLMRCVERLDGSSIDLTFLDMGPNLVAVTPVVGTLAQTTGDTKHSIDIPITQNVLNDPVRVEYAITATDVGTIPVEGSALWTWGATATADETVSIPYLPSDSRIWIRARSYPDAAQGPKLPSAWVVSTGTDYVDTDAITAPSGVGSASITGSTAEISWTVGDALYDVEILLTLGAVPGSWSNDDRIATLPDGSAEILLRGLDSPSTQHTVGVRHRDRHGGYSSIATHTFSTGATDPTAPRPAGICEANVTALEGGILS